MNRGETLGCQIGRTSRTRSDNVEDLVFAGVGSQLPHKGTGRSSQVLLPPFGLFFLSSGGWSGTRRRPSSSSSAKRRRHRRRPSRRRKPAETPKGKLGTDRHRRRAARTDSVDLVQEVRAFLMGETAPFPWIVRRFRQFSRRLPDTHRLHGSEAERPFSISSSAARKLSSADRGCCFKPTATILSSVLAS